VSCASVKQRLSAYLDDDLGRDEGRSLAEHLAGCASCSDLWRGLRSSLHVLRGLAPLVPPESWLSQVMARLEMERRDPGLSWLFRRGWAGRPLLVQSVLAGAIVCGLGLGAALVLDAVPSLLKGHGWAWLGAPEPLPPVADVSVPRLRDAALADDFVPPHEDSLFFETRVLQDGRVGEVTLLDGRIADAAPLINALRRERFEPARYKGRPVAARVYRLISRLDVRAPKT